MRKKRENPEKVEAAQSETIGDISRNDETDAKKAKIEGENESDSIEASSQQVEGKSPVNELPLFNRLPQELVAQVASHFNYDDIWRFMESSKRNHQIVKGYNLHEMNIAMLSIFTDNSGRIDVHQAEVVQNGDFEIYRLAKLNGKEKLQNVDIFEKLLENCSSIRDLSIEGIDVTSDVFKVFNQYKFKIKNVVAYRGSINLSPHEFVCLCQCFQKTTISEIKLNDDFLCDKVLCKIIPNTEIEWINSNEDIVAEQITDQTLLALVRDEYVQTNFRIDRVHNSITVHGIATVLQKLMDRRVDHISWDLGVLQSNQHDAVKLYIDKKYGQFLGSYNVAVDEFEGFNSYWLSAHDYASDIYFSIRKP